ncbi:MAG: amidohydrolase, partial [Burkholderiales bacterium]|nr:amidohydrolase [Burkholderiales bacterium]
LFSLEEAAWRLAGQPAHVFGIRGRGALKPGYAADLLLFDPARVACGPKTRDFDLPAGQPRLTVEPIGVRRVWVNGVALGEDRLRGKLLRDFSA